MYKLWENYFQVFRNLITDGWTIYKKKNSIRYTWVYPYCSLPTRFKISEANEINSIASGFNDVSGTTRNINVACSLNYNTTQCINQDWAKE